MSTKITSPIKGHTERTVFGPTTLQFTDGVAELDEPLSPGLKAYLKGRGYKVEKVATEPGAPFDPAKHSVAEVRTHLDSLDGTDPGVHDAEVLRVVEAERGGKNRSSLLESIEGAPAAPATGSPSDTDSQNGGDAQ